MSNLHHENTGSPDFWPKGETSWPHAELPAEIPYEKTAHAVLWKMGLVLGGALGFAFAVNLALLVFHIG